MIPWDERFCSLPPPRIILIFVAAKILRQRGEQGHIQLAAEFSYEVIRHLDLFLTTACTYISGICRIFLVQLVVIQAEDISRFDGARRLPSTCEQRCHSTVP
jgi:hypothetical protein